MNIRSTIAGPLVLLAMFAASPASAQQQDVRIQQLEQKLDELLRQAASIRQELDALKGTPPAEAPAPDAEEDLTKIDVATAPAPVAQPDTAATSSPADNLGSVQTVENTAAAGASKALNPDMSVIGNFLGHAGDQLEDRAPAELDEVELALEAFIDPYAKGKFFIAVGPDGVDVEEGYAQFLALPWGLTAKAGKTKATFGKVNTWHTHSRPWVDEPLMVTRFLGDEGLSDVGVSVSRLIPNPIGVLEATGEIYSGDVEGAFARTSDNDLFYNGHLKLFRDLTENSNLEVGTSWAQGTLPDTTGHNRLAGVDVTYRWKPLERSIYQSLIVRAEGVANRRSDFGGNLYGSYLSADYQIARRWFLGVRLDRADRAFVDEHLTDRGASAILTFWPSEFSQLRGQFRHTDLDEGLSYNEFLLQLQFAIGAHGAHTF
jgi:hypothetical protein